MLVTTEEIQAIFTGLEDDRIASLQLLLGYPLKERDRTGLRFWYVRAGQDVSQAKNTCPIAVGFYEELDNFSDAEIKAFLTEPAQQQRIYGHYLEQDLENMPVMYLLLPVAERSGRVAMVLPMEGGLRQRQIETFAWNSEDLRSRLVRLNQENLVLTNRFKFTDATRDFFSIPSVEWAFYKTAQTAKELAQLLAEVTKRIEQVLPLVYEAEGDDGYLHRLLLSFQRELLPSLKLAAESEKDYSFADIYAQTIAYGLFTARVFSHVRDPLFDFNRRDAWKQLPETNPFLRQLFKDVSEQQPSELGDDLIGCIAEVFGILRAAKMDAILSDFREKMNREDIVIRFYEDFLAAYKPKMRERRGVYYTPEPVVSYMVRSVDILIKEKFNKPLGLADPEVMILDPACGTGTFLLWIFKLIYDRFENDGEARSLIKQKLGDISWSDYVRDHLLPRVFGFELLMAPYAICHLKLGLFLEESGYRFDSSQRLGVYLTNTLDDAARKTETLLQEFIAEEANEAVDVKRDIPVMVIVGNPPYSVSSENNGKWIKDELQDYKKNLNERKLNLDDDFIKFIRFAQCRIEKTGYGILAYISNNSYFDGVTHRRMRESLLESFNQVFILDLHGSSKRKEKNVDGTKDQNVFDIQQGVGISIFLKNVEHKEFSHQDLFGERQIKYDYLAANHIKTTHWYNFEPDINYFFFSPKDLNLEPEYSQFHQIKGIFSSVSPAVKTERDNLSIHYTPDDIHCVVKDFKALDELEIREKYALQKDSRDWQVIKAKSDVIDNQNRDLICKILYRSFDIRYTWYSGRTRGFIGTPSYPIMKNMILQENLAFCCTRHIREDWCRHVFVSDSIAGKDTISSLDMCYFFPLYIYPDKDKPKELQEPTRPNLSNDFLKDITNKLGYTPTPEAIFYYIYAIFHSPTYRTRYAEFLKIDFPRVPLTSDDQLFRKLGEYGEELVALHLMKSSKLDQHLTQIIDKGGEFVVDAGHPKYTDSEVIINKKGDRFTGVPKSVWEFYVGGYQVCHKWLKDRKGRQLSPEDLNHYQKIIVALSETMQIMNAIDAAIPSFPIE
ncbi:MAG: N-6 DNA methylase [Pseudanabaena sp. Salubria-1]|nr:N-6 DNA methylase [Pseudanabaena sp. Salubria-1]